MTEVVAALFVRERNGRREMMICQRPEHKARGLLWEFVGGKTEPGETGEEALARECMEELDVSISVGIPFCDVVHSYPDLTVHLTLFCAAIRSGEPKLLEHRDLRWISVEEIRNYAFCPADESILLRLEREGLPAPNNMMGQSPSDDFCIAITERLIAMSDPVYRDFSARLLPTVDRERVLGVRIPDLRRYAKELSGSPKADRFLRQLPHRYFEENNLHAFLVERITEYGKTVEALDAFLPYVDNWATCDSLSPKCFRRHHTELRREINRWLESAHPYTVRFAVKLLMNEFLDADYVPTDPERLCRIRTEEYYVRMAVAWYFATALAKRYSEFLPYLAPGILDEETRKKAIQKARESLRLDDSRKEELRKLL